MRQATLALSDIRIDGGTQSRAEMQQQIVDDYAANINDGSFPAVIVFNDGEHNWLADGFYRYHAAEKSGSKSLLCEVREGTLDDAKWHAAGANKSHGLRRTNADKEKSVRMALSLAGSTKKTDREIADWCGVDHKTIAKYRAELAPSIKGGGGNGEIPHSPPETRTRRDGAAISVSSAKRSEAAKKSAAKKKETLRELLHDDVAAAWDSGELEIAQVKKLSNLRPMLQADELKKIREKAARKAKRNGTPKIEEPSDDDEELPDETIDDIIKRKNHELESFCRQIMKLVDEAMPEDEWMDHMGRKDSARQKFKDACALVRAAKCAGRCPKCDDGCRKCHNTGRMPRFELDQLGAA